MNETPQQNQPPAQPAATQLQTAPPTDAHKAQSGLPKSPYLYALITFLVGIGIGYLLIIMFPGNKSENKAENAQTAKSVALPKDAVKVQACVDQKGELHAAPKDLPQGPIYMVDKDKVVGLEYVLDKTAFEKGLMYEQLNVLQSGVNHMQVASMSASYDGVPGDYYVVDLYTVDKKVRDAIKCASPSPTLPQASPSAQVSIVPSEVITQIPVLSPAVSASPLPTAGN